MDSLRKPATFTSPSGRYTDWNAVIKRAQHLQGGWFLALPDVPISTVQTVRKRRTAGLRRDDGRLECEARNVYTDDTGHRRCDAYMRWRTDDRSLT